MFYFLGDASKAYVKHFKMELDKMGEQNYKSEDKVITISASNLGPTIVIFHETLHTDVLVKVSGGPDPETVIRDRFSALKQDIPATCRHGAARETTRVAHTLPALAAVVDTSTVPGGARAGLTRAHVTADIFITH